MKPTIIGLLVLLTASTSQAVTMAPLFFEVFDGPLAGETATGFVSYDETLIDPVSSGEIGVADGLTLELDFLGETFTEADDIDFDGYPLLIYDSGEINALDYVVIEAFGAVIDDPRLDGFSVFEIFPDGTGGFEGELFTFLVPDPAAAPMLVFALVGVRFRRRR